VTERDGRLRSVLRSVLRSAVLVDLLVGAVLALVVLGPVLLRRGYVLVGDMVFVPDMPWKPAWLGLDGSFPRAVPTDAIVWLAGLVLPGDVVQKALLGVPLLVAAVGIGRLLRGFGPLARTAGIVAHLWNPWVLERLAIGQWGFVVGYCLLPWVALAASRLREPGRRPWAALVLALGAASAFTPSSAVMAATTALAVVLAVPGDRVRRAGGVLLVSLAVSLPWVLPALLRDGGHAASGGQFALFGAQAESSAGVVASLLSMGGIWKSTVVPGERTVVLVVLLSCLGTAAAAWGLRQARGRLGPVPAVALAWLAGVSLVLALAGALGPVADLLDTLSRHAPGLGLLRDSHRFLGPAGLALACGAAGAVQELERRSSRGPGALRTLPVLLAWWPILLLPSLGWGLAGSLRPVDYPADWSVVRSTIASQPASTTVVLPWRGSYRGYAWDDRRAVLDPATRYLPGRVLVDDRVYVGPTVLGAEDTESSRVLRALDGPDPSTALRALGVRWVLVERGNGVAAAQVPPGEVVHDGRWLRLVDLGRPAGVAGPHVRGSVVAGDGVTAVVLVAALAAVVGGSRRRAD
jgi:hypothetical protein